MLHQHHFINHSNNWLDPFRFLCNFLLIFCLIFSPTLVLAIEPLPIITDGSTNTQVLKTASGIDQINIAAPDANGLSHNKFRDYNINEAGQIINNFSANNQAEIVAGNGISALTMTKIGGLIMANPNLVNSQGATVILNEVTSANNTQLLGYAEIAGRKAELIIANPNGITCAGCGFINTTKMALVAGRSVFDANGKLSGFDLGGFYDKSGNWIEIANDNNSQFLRGNKGELIPLIRISDLGLDLTHDVLQAEIIGRSIQLISSIYGSDDANIVLGSGDEFYNYDTKSISSRSGFSNEALFAIDVAGISSAIQGGNIFLIATKNGLGVNNSSLINTSKKLTINARGNIYYQDLAGKEIDLKTTGNLQSLSNNSRILADDDLKLDVFGDII
ncbi:MAG TPA: filamentous hemagglutinin N-terminal domain-containing protein, partial [Rickettsiales bacterium]|nr:filamentous hemagglutinin N-terminal domain-containing protein [Rickettsiales bacterium]